MTTSIVFGASGQLGQCLKTAGEQRQFAGLIFPDEQNANILDLGLLEELFEQYKPQYIINCAAYTAVDKAETDTDIARKINRDGPENLARLCKKYDTTFVQISTDFVFEGNKVGLLSEDDQANPISVYGLTKLEGEKAIMDATSKYYILRTAWLYSEYGNNFVKTMIKLGRSKDQLSIIADQIGSPTYAMDLANAVLDIIQLQIPAYGVYHYSNEGVTSWYDFAMGIFNIARINIKVSPISTEQYPTPAKRPKFSVMDKSKIKSTFNIHIPYWRDSLEACIKILQQQ